MGSSDPGMKTCLRAAVLPLPLLLVLANAACGSSSTSVNADAGPTPEAGADASDAGVGSLGFAASNLPSSFTLDDPNDVVLSGKNCGIGAGDGQAALCVGLFPYTTTFVTQPDGSKIKVVATKTLTIDATAEVFFDGQYPIVFVAEKIKIEGHVIVGRNSFATIGAAGAPQAPIAATADGVGPGAGKAGNETLHAGGGGGGYCGLGGAGGGSSTNAGLGYGNPQIVPLVAGSTGATGYGRAGTSGGALQLVAKESIEIATGAVIDAGGREGERGAGAGSGGAILIEAPKVIIAGTLVASGGAGGANGPEGNAGERGRVDGQIAKGGVDSNPSNNGGNGSSPTVMNGSNGVYVMGAGPAFPDYGGGGGGGAGRIRINTKTGGLTSTNAQIFPPIGSPCTTQGTIP